MSSASFILTADAFIHAGYAAMQTAQSQQPVAENQPTPFQTCSRKQMDTSSREILRREHRQIAVYFGLTFFVFYLCVPQGGFADIPIQYLLKDRFKLGPERIAFVRLLIAAPTYVAFLFGFMRDRWSPLDNRDRGIFWIAGLIAALAYGWLATGEATYVLEHRLELPHRCRLRDRRMGIRPSFNRGH
jgi:hypothetical protein